MDFGDDAVAGDLQNLLFGTLKVMEFASKSIWPASAAPGNNSAPLVSSYDCWIVCTSSFHICCFTHIEYFFPQFNIDADFWT